ncbi:PAS domain-containing sensor histidine kinase [Cryptosporangium arvum]|uniref:PAS domain-containing sensor histidine kinase n=1 Tax=Cryptosporangium arvum TaxID=80871 RepID=UPI0004B4B757|nr:HAMP domain-containing sensor histidine kinase [Cryptosporangium arvum]
MTEPVRVGARGAALAAAVAALGVALSVLAAGGLRALEQRGLDRVSEQRAVAARAATAAGMRRYTDSARQAAAALGALGTLDATGFSAVTSTLANLPGVSGVSVVVPAAIARKSWPGVRLDPARSAADHYYAVLDRPLDGTLPRAGRDLGGVPQAAATLGSDVVVSDPYPASSGAALAVAAPISRTRGWVVLGLDRDDFLAATRPAVTGAPVDSHFDEVVLATGASLSVLAGLFAYLLALGRARDRARLAAAAADLQRTERSARQQATLLHAVLTSIDEGVAVADEDGTVALLNPPAQAMLAEAPNGVYRVDGVTPYPGPDLPLRRALTGAACTDEFLVRSSARPDGVRVRVGAQPLDLGSDRPGALAVSRDVTALRAHEADLTAFAGIAVHELHAPLTAVLGYLDQAGPTLSGDRLARVRAATERMRRLVDDLLAYAATRDADLRLTDVDLDRLVTEALTVVLPAAGTRAPHVIVRRLPPVRGDAHLLRRLFAGLLGNALKYTPPDETPRIAVRAHAVPGGEWIRVEIADHGIGIPAGRHAQLFSPGDPGTGLYPESDLTLAICRRIVERHHGTIAATDNAGGGTIVRFTLPAAPDAGHVVDVGTHLVGAVAG